MSGQTLCVETNDENRGLTRDTRVYTIMLTE